MTRTKKHLTLAVIVAALATTGVVSLAQGEDPAQPVAKAPVATTDAIVKAQAVLGAARGPAVTLPANVAKGVPAGGELGLDPTQARAIASPNAERSTDVWYVVPGTKGVCLALPDGGACTSYEGLRQNGSLWYAEPTGGPGHYTNDTPWDQRPWIVRGIVADGAATVRATGASKQQTVTAKAQDNAFYLDLPYGGDDLTVQDAAGATLAHQQVMTPATAQ